MDALRSRISPLWAVLLLTTVLVATASAQEADNLSLVGSETCLECHDELGAAFAKTLHGWLGTADPDAVSVSCEACHGPGSQHVEDNEPASIMVPSPEGGEAGSQVCLDCHGSGSFADWGFSEHAGADLGCTSCHEIHGEGGHAASLAKSERLLCAECHLNETTAFELPSHHPVREGFMGCSDCHDPHSGEWTGLEPTSTSRDLCVQCHSQYHGPFIFEHSPVEEDCGICHEPHGAVANHLLQQNEPFLCMQCHQPHFHSGLMTMEGEYSPPAGIAGTNPDIADLSGVSEHDSFKQVMLTKCTQCHQAVHGTDLPSQSIPGQGRALVR